MQGDVISTHAPTRGATQRRAFPFRHIKISTHAPTRGATTSCIIRWAFFKFQPTLPRGERRYKTVTFYLASDDFNPRSHEGSDPVSPLGQQCFTYFNPRSHEGSDTIYRHQSCTDKISTHAPTRGATMEKPKYSAHSVDFNPRSHEGSDLPSSCGIILPPYFNPRSHEGSD